MPPSLLLYPLLSLSTLLCSSAGAVFSIMPDTVPPLLRAAWRLWCQELIQVLPFVWQVRKVWYDRVEEREEEGGGGGKVEELLPLQASGAGKNRDGSWLVGAADDSVPSYMSTASSHAFVSSHASVSPPSPPSQPHPPPSRYLLSKYSSSLPLLSLSGFFLGVHFSSWVWSISHTCEWATRGEEVGSMTMYKNCRR